MFAGAAITLWLLPGPRSIGSITFDVHTMVYATAFVLLGFQAIAFAVFTKVFAISEGLLPPDPALDRWFRYITLELGLAFGVALMISGLAASVYAVGVWGAKDFGPLDYSVTMRLILPAALLLTLGVQAVFASFFLSVLGLRRR
jgi:hypothetical protein